MLQLCSLDAIIVPPNRQRKEGLDGKSLQELKNGILAKCLLHSPVVYEERENEEPTGRYVLVAGERRLRALKELRDDGLTIKYNNVEVPLGECPYTLVSQLSPEDLEELELEENILRANLTWPEECAAKLKILEMRRAKNPKVTQQEVAREIVSVQQNIEEPTEAAVSTERRNMAKMAMVVPHLNRPSIKSAKSLDKAHRILLDERAAQLTRDLRRLDVKASPHKVILGDCIEVMRRLPQGTFDTIISDPPYGIRADKMSSSVEHKYDDSPEHALTLYQSILRRAFPLLKPQGIVFLFCDVRRFVQIEEFARQQLFSTFPTPIIWQKGQEGYAPWGVNGFIRTYECLLFAVKGQKQLVLPGGPDIKLIRRSTKADKSHGAEKPPEAFRWLLQLSSRPGNLVLDPCCGSGPIFPAAAGLNLHVTGIEISEEYHRIAADRAEAPDDPTPMEDQVEFRKTSQDWEEEVFGAEVK